MVIEPIGVASRRRLLRGKRSQNPSSKQAKNKQVQIKPSRDNLQRDDSSGQRHGGYLALVCLGGGR
jgi:hypothetical protein